MARIAYFVHGRGRGHAVRAQVVVPALRAAGHEVSLFGGGASASVLESDAGFSLVRPCLPGPALIPSYVQRLRRDLSALRRDRPDMLITDADMPSGHAARLLGIPALAMGHGLLFGHCDVPDGLPRWARWKEVVNAGSSSFACADRVVVHFAPVRPRTPGTRVARPDLPPLLLEAAGAPPTDEGYALTYFRDDNGAGVVRLLADRGHRVVHFGALEDVPQGVERRDPSVLDFQRHLLRCRFVVASAGNHLPAECAMLGKPIMGLWKTGDAEHRMNAMLLEGAGIGLAAPLANVDGDVLDRFETWMTDTRRAPARTRQMAPASQVVVEAVGEILDRR